MHSFVCSPDGKLAVTGGRDFTVRGWDPKTGKEKWRALYPELMAPTLYTSNGVIAASYENYYRVSMSLIDPATGKPLPLPGKLGADGKDVPLALSPDGKTLVTYDRPKPAFCTWSWPAGELLKRVPIPPLGKKLPSCGRAGFSADGKTFFARMTYSEPPRYGWGSGFERMHDVSVIEPWDLAAGKSLKLPGQPDPKNDLFPVLIPHHTGVYQFGSNAPSGYLLTPAGKSVAIAETAIQAAVSFDGQTLALGHGWSQPQISVYDLRTQKLLRTFNPPEKWQTPTFDFLPDGRLVSLSETVLVWSLDQPPAKKAD